MKRLGNPDSSKKALLFISLERVKEKNARKTRKGKKTCQSGEALRLLMSGDSTTHRALNFKGGKSHSGIFTAIFQVTTPYLA